VTLNDLPNFIECPDCETPYFLNLNKTIDGMWSAGYVNFEDGAAIIGLNDCTLEDLPARMSYAIARYEQRNKETL
jgi:hypothetical protein